MAETLDNDFIFLHLTKYGDSSLILHGYSALEGRCSYLMRGAGKKGKNINLFYPLNILSLDTSGKGSGLHFIKNYTAKYRLDSIRTNIYKSSIGLFIAEVLYRAVQGNEFNIDFFKFLENSIVLFDNMNGDFSNFHLWFLVRLCSYLGYYPDKQTLEDYDPFNSSELEILNNFLKFEFSNAMMVSLSGEKRYAFAEKMIKFLGYHLGINLNIKSLSILHKIMK